MASLADLSRTQKILLAILCFPLLPFYLCYICCCSRDEDTCEAKDMQRSNQECVDKGREDALDGPWNRANIQPNQQKFQKGTTIQKDEVLYENTGYVHDEKRTDNNNGVIRKKVRKDEVLYENEDPIEKGKNNTEDGARNRDVQPNQCIFQRDHRADVKHNANGNSEMVTVQIHTWNRTPSLSKKFSFGKGNKIQKDKVVYENKGYAHDETRPVNNKGEFAYPWDGPNLKSMRIDLNEFKQLDANAIKVKARGSVEDLVQDLLKHVNTEIEKLRAIWMWVTHHIEYDVEGLRNPKLRSGSPEEVLRTGKGVCAGYATLFQRMCSIAGLECKEVSGYSKGGQYTPGKRFSGEATHAWNAVRLAGVWHLLDSTWGAGNTGHNLSHFKFEYNEFYFLTHPALFAGEHFPLEQQWQLVQPRVSLKQFENALHRESQFYTLGLISSDPDSHFVQSDGKTTVTIRSSSPREFLQDLNGEKHHGILTLRQDGMNLEVYPPKVGKHSLKIYCREPNSADEKYQQVLAHELHCKAVNKVMRFSDDLKNPVGPSWLSEKNGLHDPSQHDAMVHTVDGRCSFSFRMESSLKLMAMLTAVAFSMTDDEQRRHTFKSRKGNRVEFQVQVPKSGLYQLCIYGNNKPDTEMYSYICNYLISCTNPKVRWPVYPLQYASWKEDYELVEPLSGVLPANREVQFKVRVPGVSQVSLQGQRTQDLNLDADGFWTGSCSTIGCTDLLVMVRKNPSDRTFTFILSYQVDNY